MALNYKYTPFLLFSSEKEKRAIVENIHSKPLSVSAIEYGNTYKKELSTGYEAPSKLVLVSEKIGHGLVAVEALAPFSYIGEYTGVVGYSCPYFHISNYAYSYPVTSDCGKQFVVDAERCGNMTRFINHHREPNLIPVIAYFDSLYHVILIAKKAIVAGESFSYNYGPHYWHIRGTPEHF
ncbi:MAG: SET domain-containing protein-lysine N-methyltransferase [Simkaniaceae bacterium]|nr:SET domain-containing protein-lysine N-methyltransferase [Simkaniaceae bacterium]